MLLGTSGWQDNAFGNSGRQNNGRMNYDPTWDRLRQVS